MQAGHRAELFSAGAGLHPFVSSKTPENENTASVRLQKLRLHGRTVCRYDYFLCPGCVARHFLSSLAVNSRVCISGVKTGV